MSGMEWPSDSEEYAGDSSLIRTGGMTARLLYGFLTRMQYARLIGQLDLAENESREVTIRLPDNQFRVFRTYNAVVKKPNHPRDGELKNDIWNDVVIEVYNIRRIA